MYIYIHTHTHTHIYIYIYIHVGSAGWQAARREAAPIHCEMANGGKGKRCEDIHIHTHTHTHIYLYICVHLRNISIVANGRVHGEKIHTHTQIYIYTIYIHCRVGSVGWHAARREAAPMHCEMTNGRVKRCSPSTGPTTLFYCFIYGSGVSVSVWAAAGRLLWWGGDVRCFVGVNLSSSVRRDTHTYTHTHIYIYIYIYIHIHVGSVGWQAARREAAPIHCAEANRKLHGKKIHTHTHIYIYTYVYVYTHLYISVSISISISIYMHACMYACIYIHFYVYYIIYIHI